MGACSSVGGPFNTYAVLQGVDKIVPVDVYVIGCPPRPENLFYALLKLQDKIDTMTLAKKPTEVRLDQKHGGELQAPGHDRADAAAEIAVGSPGAQPMWDSRLGCPAERSSAAFLRPRAMPTFVKLATESDLTAGQ